MVDLGELGGEARHRSHVSRCASTCAVSRFDNPPRVYAPSRSTVAPALLGGGLREVGLQVGLAQALPGPERERGHRARRHAEQRADLCRRLALDLGVPQHRLPAFGELRERGATRPLSIFASTGSSPDLGASCVVMSSVNCSRLSLRVRSYAVLRNEVNR